VVEPGLFRLHVGPTLERTRAVELVVTADDDPIIRMERNEGNR
jgi:hypothetical protein